MQKTKTAETQHWLPLLSMYEDTREVIAVSVIVSDLARASYGEFCISTEDFNKIMHEHMIKWYKSIHRGRIENGFSSFELAELARRSAG